MVDEEFRNLDQEERKILSKRRKRNTKVEDYYFEFENFFKLKRRYTPFSPDGTYDFERHSKIKEEAPKLRSKLIENFLGQLPE